MVFTEVVRPDNVSRDLKKCCDIFSNTPSFIVDGKLKPTSIWNTPDLVSLVCHNEANAAILQNVFQNICNYEKQFSGISKLVLELIASESDYSRSQLIRTNSRTLINLVNKNISCDVTKEILNTLKQYGNPQLSVSVQRSPASLPSVRFVSNPSIRLRVSPKFLCRQKEFTNNKILMINGAVNKPSELMKLMNTSFENKDTNYFLVCRSYNDEVLFTLKENYDRSITNVIPLEYGFDLESINSLPDLASVAGGLPLSADLGDLISAFSEDRLGYSEKITIDVDKVTIKPSKQNANHLKKLSKISDESGDEKRKLLSKRLINLRGNSCNVFLPDNEYYNQIEINIRHASKIFADMSKKGVAAIAVGNKKFYIPAHNDTILRSLLDDIENLMQTGIYLPRRKR